MLKITLYIGIPNNQVTLQNGFPVFLAPSCLEVLGQIILCYKYFGENKASANQGQGSLNHKMFHVFCSLYKGSAKKKK